jgi:hypothetical protein
MGQCGRRNQEIETLREALRGSPTNLELANRYWIALGGDRAKGEADLRTGSNVVEAYRAVALSSKEGVEAFAAAYRALFELSGEAPRPAYFDQPLLRALTAELPQLSKTGRNNVEWLLHSIGASRPSR